MSAVATARGDPDHQMDEPLENETEMSDQEQPAKDARTWPRWKKNTTIAVLGFLCFQVYATASLLVMANHKMHNS